MIDQHTCMETTKKYHAFSRWEGGDTHPIKLTPRDLEYLHRLFIHGPLSSAMLRQLVWPHATPPMTTGRLKMMRRKPNCLVEVPKQLRLSYNANYQHLTFKITNAGVQMLAFKGRISAETAGRHFRRQQNYSTFHHDATTAYITASIELSTKQTGIKFFGWDYIFTNPKTPEAAKQSDNPLRITYKLDGKEKALVPDALFAIEILDGKTCFALETDMHSERIQPHELTRSSYGNKLAGLAIFKNDICRTYFDLSPEKRPARLIV